MTNLDGCAKRFNIDEFFRDMKGQRLGWDLRDCQIKLPDRLDRLLLILMRGYLLLTSLGLWAKKHLKPSCWCSNNRQHECSAFKVRRYMIKRIERKMETLI